MTSPIHVAAAVFTDEDDNTVFVARRKQGTPLAGYWVFPGGQVMDDEAPEEALKRAVKEEFHIDIEVGESITSGTLTYDFGTVELTSYHAEITGGTPKLGIHDSVTWVNPEELSKLMLAPGLKDTVKVLQAGS